MIILTTKHFLLEEDEKFVGKVYKKLHSKLQNVVQRDADSNNEEVNSIVACLHKIIKPFMLRRTRNEVLLNLPTKVITFNSIVLNY